MNSDQLEQVIAPIPTLVQKQTGSPIVVLLVRDEAGENHIVANGKEWRSLLMSAAGKVMDGLTSEKEVEPSGTQRRIPNEDEVLAMFPQEIKGDNPERWLLTTEELKLKFKENGFSKNDLAALMDRLVKAGKIELIRKRHNAKFYALPEIAKKYHRP